MKSLVRIIAALVLISGADAQQGAALGTRIANAARQQVGVTTEYDAG